jgi:hypothetical protein
MKLKKLLVMPVVALSILMVGCQKDVGSSNTASTSSQVVLESMDNNINYETVPVPEGGWTVEELAKTIRINGKPIEMPFTINSLGADYQFDENVSSWDNKKGTLTSSLLYNNQPFATVMIYNAENGDFESSRLLDVVKIGVVSSDDNNLNKMFCINSVTINTKCEDVKLALGEPTKIDGSVWTYTDKKTNDNAITLWIDDEKNTVKAVYFYFKTN